MSSFKAHCAECKVQLGSAHAQVHQWLDEFFPLKGPNHRRIRHHIEGVEQVRKMWGDEAAQAAMIHIRMDFPDLTTIPKADDYLTGELSWRLEIATQEYNREKMESRRRDPK